MYERINKELEELQQGIYRFRKIESMLKSLQAQLNEQEKKRIKDSHESISKVKDQVSNVLRKLSQMQDKDKRELVTLENELSEIITKA